MAPLLAHLLDASYQALAERGASVTSVAADHPAQPESSKLDSSSPHGLTAVVVSAPAHFLASEKRVILNSITIACPANGVSKGSSDVKGGRGAVRSAILADGWVFFCFFVVKHLVARL